MRKIKPAVRALSAYPFSRSEIHFPAIADSISTEAAKYGYDVIVVDGNRNVQKQANQIDDFLTKGVSAIVLNPCDRISTGAAIKKATDAGVPVFTCDLKMWRRVQKW